MSDVYETKEYKGYKIQIISDYYMNSRDDDNLGTMYCFHSRYELGDKHDLDREEVKEMAESGDYIALPLYLYDHSGITMNTTGFSCSFDSGCVGVIMVSKEQVRKRYSWERITKKRQEQIEKFLKDEVEIYDHCLTGNVYGYKVFQGEGEELDSCWGFYGYDFDNNGLLEQAKGYIDYEVSRIEKEEGVQLSLELV